MDINTLRGISTVLVMIAFLGVFVWVYLIKSKGDFDEAANTPFADDGIDEKIMGSAKNASEDLK
jgi:cytochrome c oxidase cbb3-type subunit IV